METQVRELDRSSGYVPVEDDVELFYRTVGEGDQTVVFLHGGPGFTLEYFVPDVQPLARNRRLILYDQRSSGRSTPVEASDRNTVDDMVADLERLRQHFALDELFLVGHSWGSLLAGLYAVEYPENVGRIVMVGSAGPAEETYLEAFEPRERLRPDHRRTLLQHVTAFDEHPESMRACWDYWAINARGFHSTPTHARQTWGNICDRAPENVASDQPDTGVDLGDDHPDIRADLADVSVPTLVVHAEDDPIPMSSARAWVDALPNARLFSLTTGGHLPWIDRPGVFFPAVDAFLRGQWPAPPGPDGNWDPPAPDTPTPAPGTYEALFAAIEAAGDAYAGALADGEWERAAECFTADGMVLPPSSSPVRGHRSIAAFWEVAHDRGFRAVDLQPVEVEGIGDRAFELGKYEVSGEHEVLLDAGKYMVHWRETGDGWTIYRDIYNSSLDTRSPLEVPHYLPPPEGTFGLE